MTGDAELVVRRARQANTRLTIVSPLEAHLTHQVRAIQQSRHGNVFADTSSTRSITPNLIEWAVREIGAERVLYGTDSPLYFAPMQRARIDHADLSDHDKRLILCDNAIRLFGLQEK